VSDFQTPCGECPVYPSIRSRSPTAASPTTRGDEFEPFLDRTDETANPGRFAHTHVLRADRRWGRRTKRRLRDRRAAGNGDYLDVNVDGRLCARARDDPRFGTRPERPYPVTDQAVERMTIRVNRYPSNAMGSRVVPGAGWTCIVAVIFVGHDG
jgi:hypothetical protein